MAQVVDLDVAEGSNFVQWAWVDLAKSSSEVHSSL